MVNDDVCNIGKMVGLKFKEIKITCLMCCQEGGGEILRVEGRGFRPTWVVEG